MLLILLADRIDRLNTTEGSQASKLACHDDHKKARIGSLSPRSSPIVNSATVVIIIAHVSLLLGNHFGVSPLIIGDLTILRWGDWPSHLILDAFPACWTRSAVRDRDVARRGTGSVRT